MRDQDILLCLLIPLWVEIVIQIQMLKALSFPTLRSRNRVSPPCYQGQLRLKALYDRNQEKVFWKPTENQIELKTENVREQ